MLEERFAHGLRLAQIADRRGLEHKTVYRRFAALLRRLRADLEAQGIAGAEVEGWLGRLELAEGGRGLLQPGTGRPHVRLDGTPRAGAYLSADHWNAAGGRCP